MTSVCTDNMKSRPWRQRWERAEKQLRPCRVEHDLFLPACVELNVGIKEAYDRSRGGVPAMYSGSDEALALAVPHNLYQAWVAFVHILVQVEFQLHWKRADYRKSRFNLHFKWQCGKMSRRHLGFCCLRAPTRCLLAGKKLWKSSLLPQGISRASSFQDIIFPPMNSQLWGHISDGLSAGNTVAHISLK